MKIKIVISTLAAALAVACCSATVSAAPFQGRVQVQGKALVAGNGQRFMVRGVALAPLNINNDLLADNNFAYTRDNILPKLQALHVNMVRVYQVDVTKGHDNVMNLLKRNGIYAEISITSDTINVNRVNPQYTTALKKRIRQVIDDFAKYDNVLSFSVGNEVLDPLGTYAYVSQSESPRQCHTPEDCIARTVMLEKRAASIEKSMMRDAKAYLKSKGRTIPVGIALRDVPTSTIPANLNGLVGTDIASQYYACGTNVAERADYIGANVYRYQQNGDMGALDDFAQEVANLPVPVYLDEEGTVINSNKPHTRDWKIVGAFYDRDSLINNLSGETAYEFFNESNNFGLYYDDGASLPETAWGGAQALATQFAAVENKVLPLPASNPATVACPDNFNPALQPVTKDASITVMNYADRQLQVVQNGDVLHSLPPAIANNNPSVTPVIADSTQEFFILDQSSNWALVCKIAANRLKDGSIVSNNVTWGNACNVR